MHGIRRKSGKPDFRGGYFGFGEDIDKLAGKAMNEALAGALEEIDAEIVAYRKDPTILRIRLPLGANGCGVYYEVSVRQLVEEYLHNGDLDEDDVVKMRDAFLRIAATIHRTHFPPNDFPKLDAVPVQAYLGTRDNGELWKWSLSKDRGLMIAHLETMIKQADKAIATIRENKVEWESILEVCKTKPAAKSSGE